MMKKLFIHIIIIISLLFSNYTILTGSNNLAPKSSNFYEIQNKTPSILKNISFSKIVIFLLLISNFSFADLMPTRLLKKRTKRLETLLNRNAGIDTIRKDLNFHTYLGKKLSNLINKTCSHDYPADSLSYYMYLKEFVESDGKFFESNQRSAKIISSVGAKGVGQIWYPTAKYFNLLNSYSLKDIKEDYSKIKNQIDTLISFLKEIQKDTITQDSSIPVLYIVDEKINLKNIKLSYAFLLLRLQESDKNELTKTQKIIRSSINDLIDEKIETKEDFETKIINKFENVIDTSNQKQIKKFEYYKEKRLDISDTTIHLIKYLNEYKDILNTFPTDNKFYNLLRLHVDLELIFYEGYGIFKKILHELSFMPELLNFKNNLIYPFGIPSSNKHLLNRTILADNYFTSFQNINDIFSQLAIDSIYFLKLIKNDFSFDYSYIGNETFDFEPIFLNNINYNNTLFNWDYIGNINSNRVDMAMIYYMKIQEILFNTSWDKTMPSLMADFAIKHAPLIACGAYNGSTPRVLKALKIFYTHGDSFKNWFENIDNNQTKYYVEFIINFKKLLDKHIIELQNNEKINKSS